MSGQALTGSRWFDDRFRDPSARHSLYCLPFAGGSASYFSDWAEDLGKGIELVPVQLPGRGARLTEPPAERITAVADVLTKLIAGAPTRPLLFGHSMGAIIAFEIARRLQARGHATKLLFVSGRPAPTIVRPEHAVSTLPRPQLIGVLRDYGCAEEEILVNAELLDLLIPCIRADFAIIERYRYSSGTLLTCPIHAWCGDRDPEVPPEAMRGWSAETTGPFTLTTLSGAHFFVTDHRTEIVTAINRAVQALEDSNDVAA